MSEETIIVIIFAISYGFFAILLGLYMWYSDRENERYWEELYGKAIKSESAKNDEVRE